MNRRSFLGLFGCGVIGLATDWSRALKHVVTRPEYRGLAFVYDLSMFPKTAGEYGLCRREDMVLTMPLAAESVFRWVAPPGCEIVFPEAELDTLNVMGPESDWALMWGLNRECSSTTGCEYCGRAYFDWPSGGHCRSCAGALPAPLVGGNKFCTMMRNGVRTVTPLALPRPYRDRPCAYCGLQWDDDFENCTACGAGRELQTAV